MEKQACSGQSQSILQDLALQPLATRAVHLFDVLGCMTLLNRSRSNDIHSSWGGGENPKVVQELLGHSSISITMDIYSHVIPGMKAQAINKLSAMITESAVQSAVQTQINTISSP